MSRNGGLHRRLWKTVPRILGIFAALCLLGALAYALWPDGSESAAASGGEVAAGPSAAGAGIQGAAGQRPGPAQPPAEVGADTPDGAALPVPAREGSVKVEVRALAGPVAKAKVRLYLRGSRDPNTNRVGWTRIGAARSG